MVIEPTRKSYVQVNQWRREVSDLCLSECPTPWEKEESRAKSTFHVRDLEKENKYSPTVAKMDVHSQG